MKKIWLLTTLLVAWLLLTGCNKTVVENCWDDCINESDIDVLEHKCMEYVNKALFDNIEKTPNPTVQYFYDNSWSMEYTFTDAQFLWTYYWIKWYAKAWDKSQNFICNIYTGWWLHDLYFYNDKPNNEEPVTEEAKPIEVLWVTEYYLDMNYQIKSWDNYIMEEYKKEPTNDPIYLNSFDGKYDFIWKMYWNVLLTWYLENRMVAEWYFYETQEEMDNAPKVENWYIKYYPNWDDNPKSLNLWYMRENIFPARESFNKWDWDAIIAVWSCFFSARIDSISHFPWDELPWEMYGNNLHHFVNDWKIHTFRVEIFQPPFEWEWWYAESFIKDWEILD